MQKFNDLNGVWEHPSTGVDYVPATNLTSSNAVQLINNALYSNSGTRLCAQSPLEHHLPNEKDHRHVGAAQSEQATTLDLPL